MANTQRFRTHESLNITTASNFEIQSAWAVAGTEVYKDVSTYHNLLVQPDEDIYYGFSTSSSAILGTAANNLYLKGGDTIYELTVPYGLGSDTIYLHALRKTSSSASVRLVYT
jgi:hypothetical protein